MKFRHTDHRDKIELQMTPMIDIVFQMLVFFVMTFRIVLPEGDFNIRMPLPADNPTPVPSETPTLRLRMTAGPDGTLESLRLGDVAFTGENPFAQLHQHIRGLIDDSAGPGTTSDQEVEIDSDYNLRYEHTIQAITAVSGYIENGQRHKLVEKLRFAAPRDEP